MWALNIPRFECVPGKTHNRSPPLKKNQTNQSDNRKQEIFFFPTFYFLLAVNERGSWMFWENHQKKIATFKS